MDTRRSMRAAARAKRGGSTTISGTWVRGLEVAMVAEPVRDEAFLAERLAVVRGDDHDRVVEEMLAARGLEELPQDLVRLAHFFHVAALVDRQRLRWQVEGEQMGESDFGDLRLHPGPRRRIGDGVGMGQLGRQFAS